jgi:ComF family protein
LLRLEPPWCERCGTPIGNRCRCDELSAEISMCRSAAAYAGWMPRAIHLLKYEHEPARAPSLAELMASAARTFGEFDFLVPVPLHPSREKRRGYNQAELLATELGGLIGCSVASPLKRSRSTPRQVGLDATTRRANVIGAFDVVDGMTVAGKRLVIVDDVMTTGATLNACADALASAGASWIGVLTLARDF